MVIRIAINGFGRIGRLVFRAAAKRSDVQVVAVNDIVSHDHLAYLLKYDSIHGRFPQPMQLEGNAIVINGQPTELLAETEPSLLPWEEMNVDFVVESTGRFTQKEDLQKHIDAGAKRVVLSAPAKGEGVPTYVMGVNHEQYQVSETIVSNASCTTNCLAPVTKVLLDKFGIEEGLMTTVHALTSSQPTVDGPSKKDWRGGRSALLNIIPASTGAAKAVSLCIPEVKGKLTGMAFRVPVGDVSCVDLTVKLTQKTSYDEIAEQMKLASKTSMKGILGYTEEPVVSSDFIGSSYSSIFDKGAGIALNDQFFKLVSWYDNEMGYSERVIDLITFMHSKG